MSNSTPKANQTESHPTDQVESSTKKSAKPSETRVAGTVLVVVGFVWGVFVVLHDYFPLEDPYLKTTPFQLYFLAVISQTVFWAVAFGSMWPSLFRLKGLVRGHWVEVVLWFILFITLILSSSQFSVSCEYSLRNHEFKTNLLTRSALLVAVMAGIGSILVNIGLRNLLTNKGSVEGLEKDQADVQLVARYLELRGDLLHFLSVLGVMLGLATVAQSAKRYLILSQPYQCDTPFELKKVFVYGLYYTLILVLTFLPTFSTLITTGHRLRDDILPIPSPKSDSWSSTCAKREKLNKLLALSMTEGLRAIIAVLAPIIASLISLIGLIK